MPHNECYTAGLYLRLQFPVSPHTHRHAHSHDLHIGLTFHEKFQRRNVQSFWQTLRLWLE